MDYIIIGAGPGGYELAAILSRQGHNVTLVERDIVGGTCLNRGCIPTKVMAHAASLIHEASQASAYGINIGEPAIDFPALCARREDVVSQLRQGVSMLLGKVNIVYGNARFTGPKTIDVDGNELTADRIVIATGSTVARLPIPGADLALTSDELLHLDALPSSIAIIGGGVIGMEFASIFSALGVKVSVVEYLKEVLPPLDKDIAKRVRTAMASRGVTFATGACVTSVGQGKLDYDDAKGSHTIEAEVIVMATGRRPNLPQGLELAGIETERGAIKVDPATYATTAPDIYAIGDVNGLCMLAHAATAQARIVAGEDVNTDVIPSVIFTHPEAAAVGLTEAQCKERGVDYHTAKVPFRGNGKAVAIGQNDGIVKMIADNEGHIIGCQIVGPHASDLIGEVSVAIANRLTPHQLSATIHPHPTLLEILSDTSRLL